MLVDRRRSDFGVIEIRMSISLPLCNGVVRHNKGVQLHRGGAAARSKYEGMETRDHFEFAAKLRRVA